MKYLDISQKEAQLRLFKTYLYNDQSTNASYEIRSNKSIESGIIFYSKENIVDSEIIELSQQLFGVKPEEWNTTLHKSFKTVIDTPIEELIAQQVLHYFTTYGLEALGLYNEKLVYIPHEALEVPEIQDDIPMIVIKSVSETELTEDIMKLITSGIALSKQTIKDIMLLSDFIDLEKIDDITNREIKTALYEKYNIVPNNNLEFLRYLIFKTTGDTLLIKNKELITKIKNSNIDLIYNYLNNYVNKPNGYERLAEIYLRYKPLFLAYKREKGSCTYAASLNHIINRLDKFARIKGCHKQAYVGILDSLTKIKNMSIFELSKSYIVDGLNKATIFREIRIINALAYRVQGNTSVLYKIRNGKAFASSSKTLYKEQTETQLAILNFIYDHLKNRINKLLENKSVYLPANIEIAAPTSEKQYIGYLPFGSKIIVPRTDDMILGVHWFNLDDERVDIDVHAMNMNQSFGWNSAYRSDMGNIVFSGDVTDAPRPEGATELFAISKDCEDTSFLITLNDFTRNKEDIPYEFIIASDKNIKATRNYVIDPNKIIAAIPGIMEVANDNYKNTLGLVKITKDQIEFNFNKFDMGSEIITSRTNVNKITYNYLDNYSNTQIMLSRLLRDSGVDLKDTPEVERLEEVEIINNHGETEVLYKKVIDRVDYDLSLNKLDKTTIIDLLTERN